MLNVSDIIEIKDKHAMVCHTATINNKNYIIVSFLGENLDFEVYDYKYENDKLLISLTKDENEVSIVMKDFLEEGISEFGLPSKLEGLFDNYNNEE